MKVAHILRKYDPSQWAGTETYLSTLYGVLKNDYIESQFYYPERESQFINDPLRAHHQLIPYSACVPVWGISKASKKQLKDIGGNLMSFDLPWRLWHSGADVIHSHTLGRLGAIGRFVANRKNIPFVITIHGGFLDLPHETEKQLTAPLKGGVEWGKIFGALLRSRQLVQDADAVIAVNQNEYQQLIDAYPGKRIELINSGIDTALYEANCKGIAYQKWPQLKEKKVLLEVGRIDPVKNQFWLLEQFVSIAKKEPQALLVFAGPVTHSDYFYRLQAKVKDEKLSERVLFTGGFAYDDPELIGLYQVADVCVLPSVAEPFGLVMLEAWAAKKPVVANRTTGSMQLVVQSQNGFLFDVSHPETFHQGIQKLLEDKKLAEKMGKQGFEKVLGHYDTKIMAKKTLKLYQEIIEQKAKIS